MLTLLVYGILLFLWIIESIYKISPSLYDKNEVVMQKVCPNNWKQQIP